MASERVTLRFSGLLIDGATSGSQSAAYNRVAKTVQLSLAGQAIAPTSTITIQLRLAGVTQTQTFTMTVGQAPVVTTTVSGNGLAIGAGVLLDAVSTAGGSASDLDVFVTCESATQSLGADTDAGLGMLSVVRAFVLADSLQTETKYDAFLLKIALGVARAFDRYTARTLVRVAGHVETFQGDRSTLLLRSYPVESVAEVALKSTETAGYVAQTGAVDNIDDECGLLRLNSGLGTYLDQVRVTYTGGYWYDSSVAGTGSLPSGATALPEDITLAWLLQIKHVWDKSDPLRIGLNADPEDRVSLTNLKLVPEAKDILDTYRRFALL